MENNMETQKISSATPGDLIDRVEVTADSLRRHYPYYTCLPASQVVVVLDELTRLRAEIQAAKVALYGPKFEDTTMDLAHQIKGRCRDLARLRQVEAEAGALYREMDSQAGALLDMAEDSNCAGEHPEDGHDPDCLRCAWMGFREVAIEAMGKAPTIAIVVKKLAAAEPQEVTRG